MNKSFTLIAYLIFILFINTAFAQDILKIGEEKATKRDTKTFNIISLDGKNEKVTIIPDYVKRVLRVSCLKDTISISDFWGVPTDISPLSNHFIEINYAVRGGSNLGLGNTLIMCMSHDKLYEAMHISNYINWDTDGEKANYHVKLTLNNSVKTIYKLKVSIHDRLMSKHSPEKNYNYNNETVLNFDVTQNVFYSIKKGFYNGFIITKAGKKQKVNGMCPVILLGKETYYFLNNKWYQPEDSNRLDEF